MRLSKEEEEEQGGEVKLEFSWCIWTAVLHLLNHHYKQGIIYSSAHIPLSGYQAASLEGLRVRERKCKQSLTNKRHWR